MPVGDAVQFKFVDMIIVHINNNCNRVRVDLFAEGQQNQCGALQKTSSLLLPKNPECDFSEE